MILLAPMKFKTIRDTETDEVIRETNCSGKKNIRSHFVIMIGFLGTWS